MNDRDGAPASPREAVGSYLPGERNVPRQRRIYTNRNLRMEKVLALGFDMDHTLALYRRDTYEPLTFDLAARNLVEAKGYPEGVLGMPYDPHYIIRGLVVDKRHGNILKMDFHDYVARAYHGTRELSKDERRRSYRGSKINLRNERYQSFDTLFSMPEGSLFGALVHWKESEPEGPLRDVPDAQIFSDVRACVDQVHRDGTLKEVIIKDPGRYFLRDDLMGPTLLRFRARGKKLFLVTNSEHDYTEAVMSFLLNRGAKDWKTLFDLVIVQSRKPDFFTETRHAEKLPLDGRFGRRPHFLYKGGDAGFVEEFLGANGDQVLYFGDHTYGDILRSKKTVGWRTAMIVQELEHEVSVNESQVYLTQEMNDLVGRSKDVARDREQASFLLQAMRDMARASASRRNGIPPWASGYALRELERFRTLAGAEQKARMARLEATLQGLDFLLDQTVARLRELQREISRAHNPLWGHLFREANEMSRFGRQVKEFACIYSSRVSNFLNYPVDFYFIAPDERLPHEV